MGALLRYYLQLRHLIPHVVRYDPNLKRPKAARLRQRAWRVHRCRKRVWSSYRRLFSPSQRLNVTGLHSQTLGAAFHEAARNKGFQPRRY